MSPSDENESYDTVSSLPKHNPGSSFLGPSPPGGLYPPSSNGQSKPGSVSPQWGWYISTGTPPIEMFSNTPGGIAGGNGNPNLRGGGIGAALTGANGKKQLFPSGGTEGKQKRKGGEEGGERRRRKDRIEGGRRKIIRDGKKKTTKSVEDGGGSTGTRGVGCGDRKEMEGGGGGGGGDSGSNLLSRNKVQIVSTSLESEEDKAVEKLMASTKL